MEFRDDLLRVVEPYPSLRLVLEISVYLSRLREPFSFAIHSEWGRTEAVI
jgi:hypothetical protein